MFTCYLFSFSEDTAEARASGHEGYLYLRNFLINLSIVLLVCLLFLLISKIYKNVSAAPSHPTRGVKTAEGTELMQAKAN